MYSSYSQLLTLEYTKMPQCNFHLLYLTFQGDYIPYKKYHIELLRSFRMLAIIYIEPNTTTAA